MDTFPGLQDPDRTFYLWKILEGLDWRILLTDGGIYDQPEADFRDVLTVANMAGAIKAMIRRDREKS